MMAWTAGTKPAVSAVAGPAEQRHRESRTATPCFTYQTAVVGGNVYVTDVAITLTVQTQLMDPVTKQYQTQTKALLNVSPRNMFNAWQMASLGITEADSADAPQHHRVAAAARRNEEMTAMTRTGEQGRRARLHAVPDGGAVGDGRVADVPGADRNLGQPELQDDVAGALRGRGGRAQGAPLPVEHGLHRPRSPSTAGFEIDGVAGDRDRQRQPGRAGAGGRPTRTIPIPRSRTPSRPLFTGASLSVGRRDGDLQRDRDAAVDARGQRLRRRRPAWSRPGGSTRPGPCRAPLPATVEVAAILERDAAPAETYAIFATGERLRRDHDGGSAETDSYDSTSMTLSGGMPATQITRAARSAPTAT